MKQSNDQAAEQYQQINDDAAELSQVEIDERIKAGVLDELRSKPESFVEAITEQDNWGLIDIRSALICSIDTTPDQEISDRLIGERLRQLVYNHIAANVREHL